MRPVVVFVLCVLLAGCTALRGAQIAFVTTKAIDVHSTKLALDAGGREVNPFLPDAWYWQTAVAGAGAATVLYLSERLAKQDKRGVATAILAAAATAYAVVAAHNYRLAHHMKGTR